MLISLKETSLWFLPLCAKPLILILWSELFSHLPCKATFQSLSIYFSWTVSSPASFTSTSPLITYCQVVFFFSTFVPLCTPVPGPLEPSLCLQTNTHSNTRRMPTLSSRLGSHVLNDTGQAIPSAGNHPWHLTPLRCPVYSLLLANIYCCGPFSHPSLSSIFNSFFWEWLLS